MSPVERTPRPDLPPDLSGSPWVLHEIRQHIWRQEAEHFCGQFVSADRSQFLMPRTPEELVRIVAQAMEYGARSGKREEPIAGLFAEDEHRCQYIEWNDADAKAEEATIDGGGARKPKKVRRHVAPDI